MLTKNKNPLYGTLKPKWIWYLISSKLFSVYIAFRLVLQLLWRCPPSAPGKNSITANWWQTDRQEFGEGATFIYTSHFFYDAFAPKCRCATVARPHTPTCDTAPIHMQIWNEKSRASPETPEGNPRLSPWRHILCVPGSHQITCDEARSISACVVS